MKPRLNLTGKLALAIVATSIVPAAIIGTLAVRAAMHSAEGVGENCRILAQNLADKIDRNLFERYGDVQAFGANDAVNDRKSWYQVGSDKNKIAAAANRYANLYGFYLLSYLVDLDGKVVAVNDRDPGGKAIDTSFLYQKNFKDAEWFRGCLAGQFTKSETLDGTFVEDLHADNDVKQAYPGDGLVLGFSAPVKDPAGKIIAVWHNCANFSLVEEVVSAPYPDLKRSGCPGAQITLLDRLGRVIVDYDPATTGKDSVQHDSNVLLKLNLAQSGLKSAQELVAGRSGHGRYLDPLKQVSQVTGFAPCTGALGFPGNRWGVLIRIPAKQALAATYTQAYHIGGVIALSVLAMIAAGLWLGRSISQPLILGISALHEVGDQVSAAAREVSNASQTTAQGASEQAASLEESSASLEEISSMTRRNAENASNGTTVGRQTRDAATAGLDRLAELNCSLAAIKAAVDEMKTAVNDVQNSSQEISKIIRTIDEIAFQTNLLALNAAVEAARAGEAGMGFAVVADEVRALAQRSAQAAKDTSDKIEAAIKRSELGGSASAKVVLSLAEVESTARSIEQVFNGIVSQVKTLDEVISEIAAASKEQSQGLTEVNSAVGQMDKVTQSNAASAEENASAAEELNGQVATLQNTLGQLRSVVAGDNAAASAQPAANNSHSAPTLRGPSGRAAKPRTHPPARTGSAIASGGDIPMPKPATYASKDASPKKPRELSFQEF